MISWNHRIVREADGLLRLSEVHYDKSDKPVGYSEPFMCGDSVDELRLTLKLLLEALDEPILDESECKSAPLPHEVTDGATITYPTPPSWVKFKELLKEHERQHAQALYNQAVDAVIDDMLSKAGIVFPKRGE